MLSSLKETIKELAFSAVTIAEETLNTSSGQEKKNAAIEYVVAMLPVPAIFKTIISMFLSNFIDEAIEEAVAYMKSIQNPKEEETSEQEA